jgi:hypothetical protein
MRTALLPHPQKGFLQQSALRTSHPESNIEHQKSLGTTY